MNPLEHLRSSLPEVEAKLGYIFKQKDLLVLAFSHKSFLNEFRNLAVGDNERLEFLGDTVLGLILSDFLYHFTPTLSEGEMSFARAKCVEAGACVNYLQKLDVSAYLLMGKGERMNDGRGRESLLADLFEAIIGAIYLDGGLIAAQSFLFGHFKDDIYAILQSPLENSKADLQDLVQKRYQTTPVYEIVTETGPDHSKQFEAAVLVQGEIWGKGSGASKKLAQQSAAKNALDKIKKTGGSRG